MSKLGYISKSYGSSFNVAIANTYGFNVLSGNNLPLNSLIVASPIDDNNDDTGTYSLLVTDNYGNPIRLTYTIKEGNGIQYLDDSLKIVIDNDTIIENKNRELSLNIENLIDNDLLKYDTDTGYVYISYDNLTKASKDNFGLYKIDEKTVKISDDTIYVDTSELNYANTITSTSGIVIGDGDLITADQGVLYLNEEKIARSTVDTPGFIYSNDGNIIVENGIASVDTENLDKCTYNNPGIVIPDNESINIVDDSLSVDTNNLKSVGISNAGVFKYDSNSFSINNDILTFKDNDILLDTINSFDKINADIKIIDNDIDYLLNEYQIATSKPSILDFHCSQLLTGVLEKPIKLDENVNEMESQFIDVVFMIATNCPFKISLTFENNLDPQFSLHEINYNDIFIYNGNEGLDTTYQTTEGKSVPLKFTFIGKNYYNANRKVFSNKVNIKIVVSYANDGNIFKEILYSIIRYNSGYKKEIEYNDENIENVNRIEL